MLFPFAFAGRMRPLPYAASSLSCFISQHLLAALVLTAQGVPVATLLPAIHSLCSGSLGTGARDQSE